MVPNGLHVEYKDGTVEHIAFEELFEYSIFNTGVFKVMLLNRKTLLIPWNSVRRIEVDASV